MRLRGKDSLDIDGDCYTGEHGDRRRCFYWYNYCLTILGTSIITVESGLATLQSCSEWLPLVL